MLTGQVLDFSFCLLQLGSPAWPEARGALQVALAAIICVLVAIQFIKQSLQMYKVTKRIELSRYVNRLVREGMFYFLAYVHFLFHATKQTVIDLWIAS